MTEGTRTLDAGSTDTRYETAGGCPLCAAPPTDFGMLTRHGDRFEAERAVVCRRCGLVFLDPRLTAAALETYYLGDAFSREVRGGARPNAAAMLYRDMRARRRWRLLAPHLPDPGRALEVGCGAGNFLRLLGDGGWRALGIDPSRGFAEHGREQGLDIRVGHFPAALEAAAAGSPAPHGNPHQGAFDLVVVLHVLEHVPNPLEMLRGVRRVVADGGLLVLEYPDVEKAARRRFLPPTYFERQHLFDFSLATLTCWLARAGFAVEQVLHDGPEAPYDRNVLLVCSAGEAEPDRGCHRPDEAGRLEARLRHLLRLSTPLLPLRPLVKAIKRRLGLYRGLR